MPRGRPAIPTDRDNVVVGVGGREVRLTNLRKPFWPALGITKGGLLQFYLDVAPYLLPHIRTGRWCCGAIPTAPTVHLSS